MKLYLVQHGDALPKDQDPDRPLSTGGLEDVASMAEFLAGTVRVGRVLHSGKTRARQTAELLAEQLAPAQPVEAVAGISPNDSTNAFTQRLISWNEDLLVVGHLPFMSRLVSLLVGGQEEPPLVGYQPGSMVCLESTEDGGWQIQWMLRPELLS